jgi:tripartite-type tricarboxylate transporter receptor subunit TctC
VTAWFSLSGPPGLPAPLVERLNALVNQAMAQPDVRRSLERDASLASPMSVAEFTRFMQSEVEKWTPVVRTLAAGK